MQLLLLGCFLVLYEHGLLPNSFSCSETQTLRRVLVECLKYGIAANKNPPTFSGIKSQLLSSAHRDSDQKFGQSTARTKLQPSLEDWGG